MNLHNMRQKSLFESYIPPSPVLSRCYSSKANMNSFTTTHLPGNSLFSMNKYLGNVGNFNKKNHGVGPPGLRMPLVKGSGFESGVDPIVKIVGGFVGSKSQAGSSNHRGREFSLWDVILDKIIESMEHPEQQKQPTSRKWGEGRKMAKIEGFAMIGVRRLSEANDHNCVTCIGQKWAGLSQECGESVCRTQFPELGVANGQDRDSERSKSTGDTLETRVPDLNDKPSQDCISPDLTDFLNSSGSTEELPDKPSQDCISSDLTNFLNSSGSTEELPPVVISEPLAFDQVLPSPPSVETCGLSRQSPCESPARGINLIETNDKTAPAIRPCSNIQIPRRSISESEDDSIPSDVLSSSVESHSVETFLPHRKLQRTISECSADSDDSFIVFESTEDEPVIFDESDDDDSSSDEDLDEIDNCVLIAHNCDFSAPQQTLSRLEEANLKWNKTYGSVPVKTKKNGPSKKVKFAKGKDLTQVKRLVAWDFAHRAARVGPWEMYHRDSERFKLRISSLSSVISPVLSQTHRKKIYSQRFQT